MKSKKTMTLGVDLSAYVTLALPEDTEMTPQNLIKLARQADEDGEFNGQEVIYQPEWASQEGLRIVCAKGEGGLGLQHIPVSAPGIDANAQESFAGSFKIPGRDEPVQVSFVCRKGATEQEKELAFFHALVEEASALYDYLSMGDVPAAPLQQVAG